MSNSRPAAPRGLVWAASVGWAALPLLTCGLATPFTIGFAAFWLRSLWQLAAAAFYTVCIGSFVIVVASYDDLEAVPEPTSTLSSLALVVSWIGGVIHSGILVPAMASRARLYRGPNYPPTVPYQHHHAGPPPHHQQDPRYRGVPQSPGPHSRPGQGRLPDPRHSGHGDPRNPAHAGPHQGAAAHQGSGPQGPRQGSGSHHGAADRHQGGDPRHGFQTDPQHRHATDPRNRTTNPSSKSSPQAQPGEPSQLRPGEPDRIGPYRVVRSLGRGGQGAVYLATAPSGGRVAIKVLHDLVDETARARFAREVEAARRVATFSTARLLDVNITGQHAYLVSEYVEGPSLEQLVRRHGPRDEDSLTRLALSTAGALAAIHKAGIVHRDFKPSNVLIGNDGPRVIDFGIARALDQMTVTSGKMIGTPPYMSPEQLSGAPVGPPSDVFSWAVTMVFAATGRPAFGEDTVPAVFNRVLTVHPDLSPLPSGLRSIVGACLHKQPDDRPTASEVMLAIVD